MKPHAFSRVRSAGDTPIPDPALRPQPINAAPSLAVLSRPRISRVFRWLAFAIALFVGVPVVGVAIVLARMDPNEFKPRLVAAISAAIGRPLMIGGPLRIAWSLWPTISATDVRLANLPGGSRADMAHAERIDARIAPMALLQHRIDIVCLTLTGPNILLEQAGRSPNWVFAKSSASSAGLTLRFRHVVVVNGMVTFHFPARTTVIGIRSLDFQRPLENGPLDLATVLVYSDFKPFALRAHATPTGATTAPWATDLALAAFDATATAHGTMSLAGPFNLRIGAHIPALEALNALLPQLRLPALHGLVMTTQLANGPARGDLPVIGATVLRLGSADLSDRLPGLHLGTVTLSLPAAGGLAKIVASGGYDEHPFTLSGTVGVPEYPDRPDSIPLDLHVSAPGLDQLSLVGHLATRNLGFDGLDARMTLDSASLIPFRTLSPFFPAITDLSMHANLSVPADMHAVHVHDLALQSAQTVTSGDVDIDLGLIPFLHATIHAARIDLDALLPAAKSTLPLAAGPIFPTAPLGWSMLRDMDLDLDAHFDTLTYRKRVWQDPSLEAHLVGARLNIKQFHLVLPGGAPIDGSLTADANTSPPRVALIVHAPAIPLSLIMTAAELPGPMVGSLAVDAQLQATGLSPHALAAALDGPISLTSVGGSLSDAALVELAGSPLAALGIKVPPDGQTSIRCFGLIGAFSQGVGRFPTIALDTGYLDLDGAGQVDLGRETLALKLHPLAHLSGSRVAVPVLVEGGLRDIHGRLDASGLDKLGLLIDAWFGGDHPRICTEAGLKRSL